MLNAPGTTCQTMECYKVSNSCDDPRTVHSAPVRYKLPVNPKYWKEILDIKIYLLEKSYMKILQLDFY